MCDIVTHRRPRVNFFQRNRRYSDSIAASDNQSMSVFTCCRSDTFKAISRAMAKSASARLRQLGVGATAINWTTRATACERCPMRVVSRGISYCGDPFLERVDRVPLLHGCGCPTHAKAKDPSEHCPLDSSHQPAKKIGARCTCKWCEPGL